MSDLHDKIQSSSTSTNKFLPDGQGFEELGQKMISSFIDTFRPLFEPVQVAYSNEILANQIHDISVLLLISNTFIMFLIALLLLNILFLIYYDKLMILFKNKLIRAYLNLTKKFVALEVFVGGLTILYFMYSVNLGIHFIVTHPIVLS